MGRRRVDVPHKGPLLAESSPSIKKKPVFVSQTALAAWEACIENVVGFFVNASR